MYLYACAEDDIDIIVQHVLRQTVARDAIAQHAAELRALFIDNRMMAHQLQIERTG